MPSIHVARGALSVLLLAAAGTCLAQPSKTIAITFDDLPLATDVDAGIEESSRVNEALLAALARHGVKAVAFVNEDKLYRPGEIDRGVAILGRWLDAGMELGNHNYGHVGLWASSLSENEDAVIKGEAILRRLTRDHGSPLRFYRHPYTQTGRDENEKQAFEEFLHTHGYSVAPFTIEHDDSVYACVYDRKLGTQGTAAERQRIISEYLQHLAVSIDTFESMAQQIFGRPIPQILLIHANRLNAQTFDETLSTFEKRGYTFVTLPVALADPAYRSIDLASKQFGPSWLMRWAKAKHMKLTVYGQPDPTGWTAEQAARLCKT